MPSPFPGMDPYLEAPALWPDFHLDLAAEMRSQLTPQLGPRYRAELASTTVFDVVGISANGGEGGNGRRRFQPDVLIRAELTGTRDRPVAGVALTAAPVIVLAPEEVPVKLARVEVYEVATRRLVTVIEILSPVNKTPGARAHDEYMQKRRVLFRSRVHLLEVDLLRAGLRPLLAAPVPPAPYYVTLSREQRRPQMEVWPIQLAHRLPVVPVPLLEPDPDVALDLQPAVASVYERGGFDRVLDYSTPPPPPPLSPEEAEWMAQLLAGRR